MQKKRVLYLTFFQILFEILVDETTGWVKGMKCIQMELGEPDASGRRKPIEKAGSEFTLDLDAVIMSLGTAPNPMLAKSTTGLDINDHKCIIALKKMARQQRLAYMPAVTQLRVQQPLFLLWEQARQQQKELRNI